MGRRAPGQAVKEEALGSLEDAVQSGWEADFTLQFWAAEPLQVFLDGKVREETSRSHPLGFIVLPEPQGLASSK